MLLTLYVISKFYKVVPQFAATLFHLCAQINNLNVYRYGKEEYTD